MNYYPAYSPSIPLPQRLSMMEQQMQQQYPQYAQNQIPANYMPPYNTGGANQQMPTAPQLQGEVVSDYETVKAMERILMGRFLTIHRRMVRRSTQNLSILTGQAISRCTS